MTTPATTPVKTLGQAQAETAERLRVARVPSPEVDARWLVEAAAGRDPRRAPDEVLDERAARELDALVLRRRRREPLQLVLGTAAFRDLELRCRPGVFVPRPETEILAGIALDLVQDARGRRDAGGTAPVLVLEPCCGTGAVGLAVATGTADAEVIMADRSAAAVALAEENRDALAAAGRLRSVVTVRSGPLMEAFDPALRGHVDLLVANPPYLPLSDLATMDVEVAGHDPHDALFGGPEGHELVHALLSEALEWLAPGGAVLLEIDARRSAAVLGRARDIGLVEVAARRDLTGADRFVSARRPERPDPRR